MRALRFGARTLIERQSVWPDRRNERRHPEERLFSNCSRLTRHPEVISALAYKIPECSRLAISEARGRLRSIGFPRLERERTTHFRAGAIADGRYVVVGDEGGRVRTRNAHPVPSGSAAPEIPNVALMCLTAYHWEHGDVVALHRTGARAQNDCGVCRQPAYQSTRAGRSSTRVRAGRLFAAASQARHASAEPPPNTQKRASIGFWPSGALIVPIALCKPKKCCARRGNEYRSPHALALNENSGKGSRKSRRRAPAAIRPSVFAHINRQSAGLVPQSPRVDSSRPSDRCRGPSRQLLQERHPP
jgi:hypothetical protein